MVGNAAVLAESLEVPLMAQKVLHEEAKHLKLRVLGPSQGLIVWNDAG